MAWEGMKRAAPVVVAASLLTLTASLTLAQAATTGHGSWVGLASGKVGDYQWSVKLRRPAEGTRADGAGVRRTCLLVGATWPAGPYSYGRVKARQCAGDSGRLASSEPPLIAAGAQPSHGSSAKVTAVGMVLAPAARRVRVTLANGIEKTIHLQRLSVGKSGLSGLGPLRYAAFVVHGAWCAERVVTENAAGTALWDSGTDSYACPSGG